MDSPPIPLNGRRAEAARNDTRILDSAREVFLADPGAPVAAVAAHAGVGISALYRRYPSKEALLQQLAADGLRRFTADLDLALAEDGNAWESYCACLHRVLDGRSQALAQRLAGTFVPTPELDELAAHAGERYTALHRRTQRAGALRADVSAVDVVLLLEMVTLVEIPDAKRSARLRGRYLALVLQSLHAGSGQPLPGRAASEKDLAGRWQADARR